jgi:hypothetical protein
VALDHLADGLLIVALDLEIGDPAVALRGPDPGMPQQILDAYQRRIGIEFVTHLPNNYQKGGRTTLTAGRPSNQSLNLKRRQLLAGLTLQDIHNDDAHNSDDDHGDEDKDQGKSLGII